MIGVMKSDTRSSIGVQGFGMLPASMQNQMDKNMAGKYGCFRISCFWSAGNEGMNKKIGNCFII